MMIKVCPFCYREFNKPTKFCTKQCYLIHASLQPNKGCFKKGHVPWSKGKKGLHVSPETEFKKDRERDNLAPVFSLRRRKHKREKYPRQFIKIAQPSRWMLYARYLWEKHYGRLIKGDIVRHINRLTQDDWIGNLVAMPRKDHFYYNFIGSGKLTKEKIQYYINRYTKGDGHEKTENILVILGPEEEPVR